VCRDRASRLARGPGLLAVGYEQFGSEAELAADPIKHLYHVYVNINVRGRAPAPPPRAGQLAELTPRPAVRVPVRAPRACPRTPQRQAGEDDKAPQYTEIHDKARAYFKRMEDGPPRAARTRSGARPRAC